MSFGCGIGMRWHTLQNSAPWQRRHSVRDRAAAAPCARGQALVWLVGFEPRWHVLQNSAAWHARQALSRMPLLR
jgi:hypothetical protein